MVNLWTAWDAPQATALLTSVAIPTSIGAGATLQALVGALLVRRWVGFPNPLTHARDLGIFLLLGGPLSCLVSATTGVTTLAVSGQIPWSLFVMTWWTWWVGNTLGVFFVTPLVLIWLAETRAIQRRRRLSVGLPMMGTLALGFVIIGYVHAQEWERLRLRFKQQAESLTHAIQTRLNDYVEGLHTLESCYASVPEASWQAFHSSGRLICLPPYGPALPHAMLEERRQNLGGYITGVGQIGAMVETALLGLEQEGIVVRIEDEVAPADQRTLYDRHARAPEDLIPTRDAAPGQSPIGLHWPTTVAAQGLHWELHFIPTLAYLAAQQISQPWVVLGGALACAILLGVLLARVYAAAERRWRTAESLTEVAHLLSQSLDAVEVGQRVVQYVCRLLKVRAAALYQLDSDAGMLVAVATANDFEPTTTPWRTLPLGMGVVGLAVCTRQLVVTADILTDPRITMPAAVRAGLEPTPVRAVLAVPLLCGDRVVGALSIVDKAGRTFDTETLALVQLFAAHAATAFANAQLYTVVQTGQARLQDLSRQLLEVQEAERRRIARELHDEAGQLLAVVHLTLEASISELPPQFREGFHQVRCHLDAIETQLRCLAHELRPALLDDLGLLPALQALARGVAARTGLCIHVDSAIEGRLAPAVETAIYRIMQEGLTNITKHAAATQVDLRLWRDGECVHGLLDDDGVGFAVEPTIGQEGPRGLGLLGIQERLDVLGGTFKISSAPGQGTKLQITLPAPAPDQVADRPLPRDLLTSEGEYQCRSESSWPKIM
jgi:signal transduction histidine kinase